MTWTTIEVELVGGPFRGERRKVGTQAPRIEIPLDDGREEVAVYLPGPYSHLFVFAGTRRVRQEIAEI